MILSLKDCCRESVAKAMCRRLVNEKDASTSQDLLYEFIVDTFLPKNMLLSILKAFILSLDRGSIPFSGRVAKRNTCRHGGCAETKHSRDCALYWSDDKDTSFRRKALTRYCVNVVMATWRDKYFSPSCLVERGLPIGLSLRMRQWILTFAVDAFLKCHDHSQPPSPTKCRARVEYGSEHGTAYYRQCTDCAMQHHGDERRLDATMTSIFRYRGVKHCPTVLDLRAPSGEVHCTRAALTALKLELEKASASMTSSSVTSRNEKGDVLTIKLEIVVIGSMHDWFSDVLLTVLQKARIIGLRVDLSAIRFEDVTPKIMATILRNLASPNEVKKLSYRHVDPLCLLEARASLKLLTGIEEFSVATCDFQPVYFNAEETSVLWSDIIGSWPKIRSLEFNGVQMCFNKIETNINNIGRPVKLPRTLRSLELADNSVNADVLTWLVRQFQNAENREIFCGDSKTFSLHALRVVREFSLGRQSQLWSNFLELMNQLKHTLKTLTVDHCNLTSEHALDMLESLKPAENSEFSSSLRRITMREPEVTWKTTSQLFDVILSTSSKRLFNPNSDDKTFFYFPNLRYFSAMVPKASDATVEEVSDLKIDPNYFTTNWSHNPHCHFEDKLTELADNSGKPGIDVNLIWEPDCDWT